MIKILNDTTANLKINFFRSNQTTAHCFAEICAYPFREIAYIGQNIFDMIGDQFREFLFNLKM
jgi:hypothetical protein